MAEKVFDRRKYRKQGRSAFNAGGTLPPEFAERSEAYIEWRVGYEEAKAEAQVGVMAHGIAREEWERRFKARIAEQLGLASESDPSWADVPATELASWPEQEEQPVADYPPEWTTKLPEAAADVSLSYWTF